MQRHLEQAAHNAKFQDCLDGSFGDKFFDWKVTICFYTALHWIHALAKKKNIAIGSTHDEVTKSINPDRADAKMKINKQAFKHYRELHNYSRAARYDGMTDVDTFEKIMQGNYGYCQHHLSELKKYLQSQGLSI